MTKWLKNILIIVLLLTALFFIMKKANLLPSVNDIFAPKPVVIDNTPLLIKDIKQISQLFTITIYDEVVMDSVKYSSPTVAQQLLKYTMPGSLPVNLSKVVLIAKGKIIAGIDLQKISDNDIFFKDDSISLKLPEAQILDIIVNPSDVTTFSETGNWKPEEIIQIKGRIKLKLEQRAIAQGVINKANTQGKAVMENFLRTLGFKKVEITSAD